MLNAKQQLIEFGFSIILYAIAVFFSISFLTNNPNTSWSFWVSVIPVLPALMVTIAIIRRIFKLDELQQRIQLISFAISFAVVGLTTFTYGFLENVGVPHIPYVWIFPLMIATWGISNVIVARVYK